MKIIVDADACPKGALAQCFRLGERYGIELYTVANYHHQIASPHHIVVDGDSQAADMKIANLTAAGDLVVTQDWGLAALILGKGAQCLHPNGRRYQTETIGFLLEEREAKARLRRNGQRTKGPKKREPQADEHFGRVLEELLLEGLQAKKETSE